MDGSQKFSAHGKSQAKIDTSCTVLLKERFIHLVNSLQNIEDANASLEMESRLVKV